MGGRNLTRGGSPKWGVLRNLPMRAMGRKCAHLQGKEAHSYAIAPIWTFVRWTGQNRRSRHASNAGGQSRSPPEPKGPAIADMTPVAATRRMRAVWEPTQTRNA